MRAADQEAGAAPIGASRQLQTFLFADLAGFAALTEAHGDDHAADLVGAFCAEVGKLLPEHGAEQIKSIGDALMIRVTSAANAIRLAVRIVDEVGGRHGFPAVRVGIHTGAAVAREDDWFGATVNLAARVADAAAAGEVLLTNATRGAATKELKGTQLVERQQVRFKNLSEPVELWAAGLHGRRTASSRLEIDPVCRMAVALERAAATIRRGERTFYFCSAACASAFSRAPTGP